ncbi:hypothetical protein Bbelb_446200 [Branchiostoma belcheri]|nr:hypothetical protein Bbelb_446200 [Branchiostoma belcheri]
MLAYKVFETVKPIAEWLTGVHEDQQPDTGQHIINHSFDIPAVWICLELRCLDTDTLVAQWVKPLFGAPLATGSGRVLGIRRSQFHRFDIWWTAGMDNRWSSLLHPLPTSGPAHMTLGTRGARLALVMDGCQALGAKGQGSNSAVSC